MIAFTDSNGGYYQHDGNDTPPWAIGMTPCEVIAQPTPDPREITLAQIRAIEAEGADDQARMNRIVSLESCLKWAMEQPAAAGLTREQVHTVLLGQNLGYARLYAKEQQIVLLRAQL